MAKPDPEAPVLQECGVDNNASPDKPVNCGMPLKQPVAPPHEVVLDAED